MIKSHLLLTSLFFGKFLAAQEPQQTFVTYRDTMQGFSIKIPSQWKYGINKAFPKLALVAMRAPAPGESVRDNFNINIVSTPGKTLEQTFAAFTNALKKADNFHIVAQGDTTINGEAFKWIIETHKNQQSGNEMLNYDFVTIKNEKTYILTLVTFAEAFPGVRYLFSDVAGSFLVDK